MKRGVIGEDDMKREYDFSRAARGKFFRKGETGKILFAASF